MVVRETRPPNVIRTPLGTGDVTISSPGIYRLSGSTSSVTVTADNVDIDGERRNLQKMDVDADYCSIEKIRFGETSGEVSPQILPTTRQFRDLSGYLCWSKRPIKASDCDFADDDQNSTKVGLLLGSNTDNYQSATLTKVNQSQRLVEKCRFSRIGVGLLNMPLMEYCKISNNQADHCSNGFVILGGNTAMNSNSAAWCYEGIYNSYPRTGGLSYTWTGDLSAETPTTYANAATANAFKSRFDGLILNHCFYGIHVRETLNGSDPESYAIRITGVQMQANAYGVFNSGVETLKISNGYVAGSTNAFWTTSGSQTYLHNVTHSGGVRSGSTGIHFGHLGGSGTPEGNVLGSIGDYYSRYDGSTNTSFYVKESGDTTNTGWVAK